MNEHFGLCSQWKSRCLETLRQLDATIDDVTATANQIYHISAWQSYWRHRLWRRELHMNLSRVSSALWGPRCLLARPHYSARPKRFGPCGPSEVNWPRETRKTPYMDHATVHVHSRTFLAQYEFRQNYYLAPWMARFARNHWGKANRQWQEKLYQILYQIGVLHQVVNKRYRVFSSSSTVNGFSCWPLQHNFWCCFLWMASLSGSFI